MKKFFNDHVMLCFIVVLVVAATALYLSLRVRKDQKQFMANLDGATEQLEKLADAAKPVATVTGEKNAADAA